MGFFSSYNMSSVFLDYLRNVGPISITETVEKYHTCHPYHMGMGATTQRKELKDHAASALENAVVSYVRTGVIEVVNRHQEEAWSVLRCTFLPTKEDISEDEATRVLNAATTAEYHAMLLACFQWDSDGNWIWFDPIVWTLTEAARQNPTMVRPFCGVDD